MLIETLVALLGRLFGSGNRASGVQLAGHTNQQAGRDIINVHPPADRQSAPANGGAPAQRRVRLGSIEENLLLGLAKQSGVAIRTFGGESVRVGDLKANSADSPQELERLKAALDRIEALGLTRMANRGVVELTNSGRREARVVREQRIIMANSLHYYEGNVATDFDRAGKIVQIGPFEREYSPEREEAFERLVAEGVFTERGAGTYKLAPGWAPLAREYKADHLLPST